MKKLILSLAGFLAVINTYPQVKTEPVKNQVMIHQPEYCLFYDNHTMPACPDVGENFDPETFTDRIKRCGADYLTFHARCNMGMAYYDTEIGIKHPSLRYDLFGKLAEACRRKGIALIAYLHAGISSAEGLLHRDWTTISFDGRSFPEPRLTPYVRTMCFNSPYRDHLIAMVEEIAAKYPVSGFFIDGLQPFYCVCPVCIREMKEQGIDYNNYEEVGKFSDFSALRLAHDIARAARAVNPNFLLYFKGISLEQQKGLSTHIEFVHLPTTSGGYEILPVLSHYIRTLDMPVLNMTGRFFDWGDFGGLRPEAAIKYDLLYGLANGMRPCVGGHFHPRGDPGDAVFDRIEKIYRDLQTRDPWYDNARNITEIAVVYPKGDQNILRLSQSDRQLQACVRMLCELKYQFDVVTTFSDWSKYKVLVIPDDIIFTEEIARRVKAHITAGKAVITSGSSGLDSSGTHFVLEKEWGVKYKGNNDFDPAYFTATNDFNHGLPDMPLSLYSSGIDMEALPGTIIGASLIKPYYNRMWDGEYAFYYTPPDKVTDKPALTVSGKVAHFSHRIFSGYNEVPAVELRTLFANVLDEFLPDPLIRNENLPSFSRVFVTEQPGRRMVHILCYVPELRGSGIQIIEEPVELHDLKIALRADGKAPKKVYLAPEMKSLNFKINEGYIKTTIPVSKGYSLLVFEN